MPLEEEEDEHHQQEGRGIHQQDQPIWVRVDRSILICPVLVVHLGPYAFKFLIRAQIVFVGLIRV